METEMDTVEQAVEAAPGEGQTGVAALLSGRTPEAVRLGTVTIWDNQGAAKIVVKLLGGEITRIEPRLDFTGKDGFTYPGIDDILETTGSRTAMILESMAREGVLLREEYEKILLSPEGSPRLVPVERCPNCDSLRVSEGKMIEHFSCGYVGFEEDFQSGMKMVCPKCQKELKLIGTDYCVPGMRYTCNSCQGMFPLPEIKYRCVDTGKIYELGSLSHAWLYSYRLNEQRRQRLEFELEPRKRFIEWLEGLGYSVQDTVKVQGRSGATHNVDLMATREDVIARQTVAIEILAAAEGENEVSLDSLFAFDSRMYDIGINHKIAVATSALSAEAEKFAERQGIRVYTIEETRALASGQLDGTEIVVNKKKHRDDEAELPESAKRDIRALLKWLLEKEDYEVTEEARVTGRSGARHVIDMYAQKDDGIIRYKLAICIIRRGSKPDYIINKIVMFDTAAYDIGVSDKVAVTAASLDQTAMKFIEYQRIKVIDAESVANLCVDYLRSRQKPDGGHITTLTG